MTQRQRHLADVADDRAADIALVQAVRCHEDRSGERLYDALIGAVDRTIARILGRDSPEHDDLVQATFEHLVSTLLDGSFRHECSLRSWTASIASHLALNAIRARVRERSVFDRRQSVYDEDRAPAVACTERIVRAKQALEQLRLALSAMNEERARAVVLFHVLEYDLKQVAGILGISVAAAQSRVVRGRRELLQRMAKRSLEDDGF